MTDVQQNRTTPPVDFLAGGHGRRPRVLWADDNSDMRQYVTRLLSEHYDVEAVADGQAALEAARREAPDLVLTDVIMPHLDGFELLRELRATEGLRDVAVIMISARSDEESRISGINAGADDYLVKPFSARELVARVDSHVRMALLRKEARRAQHESQATITATNEELGRRVAELERANAEIMESRQTAQSLMIDALLARERLRDADRRKDEFLATLAHELRNPLAPVRNAVAILELKGPEDEELRWARDVIDRQMQQMSRLVDDLLDVSRISRGKIELKRGRLELAKVIHGAVEASRPLIEQCAHELSVTMPTEAIWLDADETRLIDLHGGTVEARSEGLGKGSEFTVRLPILADAPVTPKVSDTGVDQALPVMSHRILIIDDNRDAADTMALMLRIKGNIVETAYDGLEAVRVASEFRPGVALLDIGLPKLDGYDTARTIRREKWGAGMVLIAVTGWGQKEDRRRSSEAGFDYHIVKPVDPSDLLQLLATLRPTPYTERGNEDQRHEARTRDTSQTPLSPPAAS